MIKFVPHPEIALPQKGKGYDPAEYGPQYKAVYLVDYPRLFTDIANMPDEEKRREAEIYTYRELIKRDLFFIGFFVCENPFLNRPFGVNQCHMVKNGPKSDTLDVWARFHLKAIDIDEPIFTTKGWRKHGELQPGDEVFGPDGMPTKIIARTPVFNKGDCYRVTFDTEYSVVVSGDHLWTVDVQSRKRIKGNAREGVKEVVLDTRILMEEVNKSNKLKTRTLPRVNMPFPLKMPESSLPIHPYALGVWLGDGTKGNAYITSALTDVDEMAELLRNCGHKVAIRGHSNAATIIVDPGIRGKRGTNSFTNNLRSLGILNDKHIPESYMLTSAMQRWELLQGLMDTDGTIHKKFSQASFANTNERLAYDVHSLACSLGLKATIHKFTGLYKGERRPFFQVMFKGLGANPPFKLQRKSEICSIVKARQTRYRRIVKVEPVPFRPVSCITVNRKDGLYLVGKHFVPTHNSSIITQYETIQHIVNDPDMCHCIFSYSKPAAEKHLLGIKETLEKPIMVTCFPDILWENPVRDSASWSLQGGIRVNRSSVSRPAHTVQAYGLLEGMPTGGHWDRLVFDDIETEDLARSPDQMAMLIKAFDMAQSFGMPDGTIIRAIGTFYTHCGLLTYIRDKKYTNGDKMFLFRKFAATDDGTKTGNLVFMSEKEWRKVETLSTCNSQYLCNPTPTHDIKLDFSLLRPIDPKFLPKNRLKFIIIDPAGDDDVQKGTTNDRWAMLCLSVEPSMDEMGTSRVFLEDGIAGVMALNEAIDAACNLYIRNGRIWATGVEKTGNDTTYEHIRKALRARGRYIEIVRDNRVFTGGLILLTPHNRTKERRIEAALSWPLCNAKLFYSTNCDPELIAQVEQEMLKFPFFHVDILDAWAYLYDILTKYEFPADEEDDEDDEDNPRPSTNTGRAKCGGY